MTDRPLIQCDCTCGDPCPQGRTGIATRCAIPVPRIPRDQTIGDFARNPDGKTFDGRKVVQFLFEATTGTPMSFEEADRLINEAQRRRATARATP